MPTPPRERVTSCVHMSCRWCRGSRLQSSEKRAREAKEWSYARVSLCSGVSGVCSVSISLFLVAVVVRWNFKPRKKIRRLAVDFRSTCAAHRMTCRQGPQPTGQAHWWSNLRGTSGDPRGERGGLPPSPRAIRGEKPQRGAHGGLERRQEEPDELLSALDSSTCLVEVKLWGVMVDNLCSGAHGSRICHRPSSLEHSNPSLPEQRLSPSQGVRNLLRRVDDHLVVWIEK